MKKETLYKQLIMDHYKKPHNCGHVSDFTHTAEVVNASCGDEISVTLKVEDGIITDLKYLCRGCAISTASASLLSQEIIGKSVVQAAQLGDLRETSLRLINMDHTSGRVKCGTLLAVAIERALSITEKNRA